MREGETVVLSTQIVGNPTPTINWFKDEKPVKEPKPKQDKDLYTLTMIQPRLSDTGEYSVKAKNELGTAETKAFLTVEGVSIIYNLIELPFFQMPKLKFNKL